MDLSKAFDILNHDLQLAKLKTYVLDNNPVTFMKSYLTNILQMSFSVNGCVCVFSYVHSP